MVFAEPSAVVGGRGNDAALDQSIDGLPQSWGRQVRLGVTVVIDFQQMFGLGSFNTIDGNEAVRPECAFLAHLLHQRGVSDEMHAGVGAFQDHLRRAGCVVVDVSQHPAFQLGDLAGVGQLSR